MEKHISNILTRFTTELGYDFSGSRGHQAEQIIRDEFEPAPVVEPVVEPEPVVAEQPPVVAE